MNTLSSRPRVLLVDDDEIVRTLLMAGLEYAGFWVNEAADGEQALRHFESDPPDVVVLDVMMPGIDGFEVCQDLRANPATARVPIIMMTGLEDEQSIRRAFDLGANDFITKPIKPALLAHRLNFVLRSIAMTESLRQSGQRLALAQRIAKLAYWEWQPSSDRLDWSASAAQVLGLKADAVPTTMGQFLAEVHPDDRANLRAALDSGAAYALDVRYAGPDGLPRILLQQRELPERLNGLDTAVVAGVMQDVTERKNAESTIQHLQSYDPLTGLPNRSVLVSELNQQIEAMLGSQQMLAVIRFDINDFKRVNDSHGIRIGDEALQQLARRLDGMTRDRKHDIERIYSLGGDEFVALLRGLDRVEAVEPRLAALRGQCSAPLFIGSLELVLSPRLGVAVYPSDGEDAETLLSNAGTAVNEARRSVRGGVPVCYFSSALNDQARERLRLETELRLAVDLGSFDINFQPKVDAQTGRPVGAEALIRWTHAELGVVSPFRFIALAEQCGLISEIGLWVLEHSCRIALDWVRRWPDPLTLAVNVSAEQLRQGDFPAVVSRVLEQTGFPPERLELEITEGVMLGGEDALSTIHALAKLGVRIAIDDFGTGYSSFAYLRRLPLHTLKVDRSFVTPITSSPQDAAIVAAIIALAHKLNLEVVAEGVEDDAQAEVLRALGCDVMQGYRFAKPMSPGRWVRWVDEQLADRNPSGMTAVADRGR